MSVKLVLDLAAREWNPGPGNGGRRPEDFPDLKAEEKVGGRGAARRLEWWHGHSMFCPCSDLQVCPGGQRQGRVAPVAQIPQSPRRERWLARQAADVGSGTVMAALAGWLVPGR